MHLFSHNVRRFTEAQSFRSFMEGVRELHHYDKEADEPEPNEDLLNLHLKKAQDFFRNCVENYSNDLLPRYYFAIVLTLQGQAEQARRLRSELLGEQPETEALSPDELFVLAAKHFETIARQADWGKGGQDLLQYSQYNRAQALAKTQPVQTSAPVQAPGSLPKPDPVQKSDPVKKPDLDGKPEPEKKSDPEKKPTPFNLQFWKRAPESMDDPMHWDTALRILQSIDPGLKPTKGDTSQVSTGVAGPLGKKKAEDRAFVIQVRVLEYAIQLRKAVHRREQLADLPEDRESEKKWAIAKAGASVTSGLDSTAATVREFIARIQEDTIRSEAQSEIVADYWNKLAFIAWERATLDKTVDTTWLQRARKYINIATAGRPNWTPAQLNLARIWHAEGNKPEALNALVKVLGKKKAAPPVPAPPPPVPDSDAIAGVILKMAVERNAKAVAAHIQRCYGALSQETMRKITETLAGKVDGGLLDEILSAVPIKTEVVSK